MKLLTSSPASRVVTAVLLTALTSGCAPEGVLSRHVEAGGLKYDAQECVENALRRGADPEILADAKAVFAEACARGEAAACSALGLMYETGAGVPRDVPAAIRLYRRACSARNARACSNLGEALLADLTGGHDPATAVPLLRSACNAGQGRACTALAHVYRAGTVATAAPGVATSLLEMACDHGDTSACLEMARDADPGSDAEQRQRQMVKACAGGDADACRRLGDATAGVSR